MRSCATLMVVSEVTSEAKVSGESEVNCATLRLGSLCNTGGCFYIFENVGNRPRSYIF